MYMSDSVRNSRRATMLLPHEVVTANFCANGFGKLDNLVGWGEVEDIWLRLDCFPFHYEVGEPPAIKTFTTSLLSFSGVNIENLRGW